MESIGNRIKANHFRKELTKGYRNDSTFYKLVYRLNDEQILQNHEEFHRESSEARALLADYKSRVAADKPRESLLTKTMRACLVTA